MAVALSGFVAGLAATAYTAYRHRPVLLGGDVEVYAQLARQVAEGRVPYRDFATGYPPLAVGLFALPRLLGGGPVMSDEAYKLRFVLFMLSLLVAAGVVALATSRYLSASTTVSRVGARFAIAAGLLSLLILWRYDIAPALCTALALWVFLSGRTGWSGVWLGLGTAAKLYPVVIGPVLCAERLARRDPKGVARLAAGGAAALALTVLPAVMLAGPGLGGFTTYHEQRGVQLESVLGGVVLLGTKARWTEATIVEASGAHEIHSPWATLHPFLTPVAGAALLGLWVLAYRRFRRDLRGGADTAPAVVGYSTLVLLLALIASKALSPQYVVWLLPMIPLLPPTPSALLTGACALTAVGFPWMYWGLVGMAWPAVLLLNARNALLLVTAFMLLRNYLPSGPRHSPSP